jgi:RimJ/RimL family protein N-acetyltransferase
MEDGDALDVVHWRNDPRISTVSESQVNGKIITLENHLTWFHDTRDKRVDYIVTLKENNRSIGIWNFKEYNSDLFQNCMEQGRLIGEEWALGRGYAKEAAIIWTRFGFDYLKLDAIIAMHDKSNVVPQKINAALGFEVFMTPSNQPEAWITLILTRDRYLRMRDSI